MTRNVYPRLFALLALSLLLTACGSVPVADDLSQNQANQIVSVLNSSGVSAVAERQTGARGGYVVKVSSSRYARAIDIITQKNLPSPVQESFADIIAPKGFMPDSREMEALRLDHALSVQLQELLSSLPKVKSARAIVRRHFLQPRSNPGVSITIGYAENHPPDHEAVRSLVSQVVSGIDPEKISLSIFELESDSLMTLEEGVFNQDGQVMRIPLAKFIFGWRVPEEDYRGIVLFMVAFGLILGLMGTLVGYWYGYVKQQSNKFIDSELSRHSSGSLRLGSGPASQLPEID